MGLGACGLALGVAPVIKRVWPNRLEVKLARFRNVPLLFCVRVEAHPLRHCLRGAFAQSGYFGSATEARNDVV